MLNKIIFIPGIVLFFMLYTVIIPEGYTEENLKAQAALIDSQGEKVGTILFTEEEKGVRIKCRVHNLEPGRHALHIHENAKCDPPDFKSAGGHFNPYDKKHGFLNPEGPHAGDLPNFEVHKDKTAYVEIMTGLVTLKEGERNSLFREKGTSVVIHEKPDDYITDPAGGGGRRIACGVIEKTE